MALVVGEASSSTLPSTSIPPRLRSCTYDVFLSFHGKDSRNGLTGHLRAALERKGIKTFIDDRDLEMGEVIKDGLLKAIEESMFAITVLSSNYASSPWCLDELQHIVEFSKKLELSSKKPGLSIVPVFYGVEPSDVRHQKGNFGEAFKKHEERFAHDTQKLKGWRDALEEVANLSGSDFKDKHEATLVECVAEHIHKKLIPKLPSFTKNLVGIASRVEEVMRHIGIGLNDDVHSIGIWGLGGIGKTTIAREVYEAIKGEFKVSCFLANIREAREKNGIVGKQQELVAKANISAGTLYNEHEGRIMIQTSLCNKKVLLVLDDVSNELELKNLAGEKDWFGPGSRIIITTRNIHLLKTYKVHGTYEVQGLVPKESFDLFCSKAFAEKLDEEYLDLSMEVVEYSGGLPLALEVLGSHLYGRPINVWHSAIEKIKSTLMDGIHDTLKISYDSLDPMEKNIFLDIACFFKGEKTNYVTNVLNKCGYNAEICIAILIDRCLVKIDEYDEDSNVFEMHDLLQDMGRSIVIQEFPNNPGERSRLWSQEDIQLVLANNKGSPAIQGIVLRMPRVLKLPWSSAQVFSNMTQLKLLILSIIADDRLDDRLDDNTGFPTWIKAICCWRDDPLKTLPFSDQQYELSSLPTSLKVLHWSGYPFKTLPLSDQQYELVDIRLTSSAIENLWDGKKFLGKLKHLDLSSSSLKRTPDLSEVPKLQTLVLNQCTNLTEVHPSLVHHKSLTLLDLTDCFKLEALPGKLEMSSLNELILNHRWSSFKNLPEFGECMKSLSRLSLVMTKIKKLPISLGCLVGLEHLNLHLCTNLECLPDITDGLPLLRTLILSDCHLTEQSPPPDFGPFPSLTYLDLSDNDFVSIPINILDSPKLEWLKLNDCEKLQCLPELPSSIRKLEAGGCWSLDISEFNILSTVCGAFVSPRQDPGPVLLEMVISGSEIPSWFVHRQAGNSVSIPCDYPRNERLVIALCFLSISDMRCGIGGGGNTCIESASVAHTIRITPRMYGRNHLHIFCLPNDYFSDGFHQDTCFEFELRPYHLFVGEVPSIISAARYVSKEDIKDLEKSVIEKPQKKTQKNV